MNELWLPSKSTPVIPNFSHKLRDSETLPSGATTIRTFDIEQLAQEQNAVFSIHPDEEVPESLSDDFAAITRIARIRFPLKRLDVITTRETFTAGNPESFRTSQIGIHYDGFEDGFFCAFNRRANYVL